MIQILPIDIIIKVIWFDHSEMHASLRRKNTKRNKYILFG
jgi:hypothetical protein